MKLSLVKVICATSMLVLALPFSQLCAQETQASNPATVDGVANAVASLKIDADHCNVDALTKLADQVAALVDSGEMAKNQGAELIIKISGVAYECQKAKLIELPEPEAGPTS